MNQSLSTFMTLAFTVLVIIGLVISVSYGALQEKNEEHHQVLEHKHQLQNN
jgi:hypothetical protein